MSNNRNLGNIATAITNATSGQVLTSQGSGVATFADASGGSSVTTVTNVSGASDSLTAISSPSVGDIVFVTSTNGLFIRKSNGWFKIADVTNLQPTNLTGVSGSALAIDGTATTITLAATDPEGLTLTFSAAAKTGSSTTFSAALTDGNNVNALNGSTVIATVAQASNVFTITPNTASNDGTVDITFSVTDGINTALTDDGQFTLTFVTIVADSNHTTLLATATSTGGNATIEDSSTANSGSGHSITVNGDAHAGTFSPYRSGGYATYFDGTGDYLTIPQTSNVGNFGTGEFTVEFWFKPTNNGQIYFVDFRTSSSAGFQISRRSSDTIRVRNGSTTLMTSTTTLIDLDTWYHVCVHRNSSNELKLFVNGTQEGGTVTGHTDNYVADTSGVWCIAQDYSGSNRVDGYITDLRVTQGESITPPSGGPTERLSATSNTKFLYSGTGYIADTHSSTASNNHSITVNGDPETKPFSPYDYNGYDAADHGGSLTFNGTNSAVEISDSDDFDFGTGDLTIECWVYPEVTGNNYPGFLGTSAGWGSVAASGFRFDNLGDSKFQMSWYGPGDPFLETQSTYKHNQWYHFVVTRTGGSTWRMFVNGILEDTGTNSTAYDISIGGNNLQVGGKTWDGGNGWFKGNVADLRLTKGSVVSEYQTTSTTVGTKIFTPRTSPISSSGSELHIKGTDASIIDKSQSTNIKLYGSIAGNSSNIPSGSSFAGTKSIYLDGDGDGSGPSGDHIRFPMETFDPKNRPYTVEFWFKIPSGVATGESTLFCSWHYSAGQRQIMVNTKGSTGQLKGYYSSSGSNYSSLDTANNVWSYDTWHHFAMVYDPTNGSNGTRTIYIDGSSVSTNTSYTSLYTPDSTVDFVIGSLNAHSGQSWEGYIYDFRIQYKCLYPNNNFTPPTAPLEG